MSPYCSAHDEWLIMKLVMYVGYHDANNVSNVYDDPVNLLILNACVRVADVMTFTFVSLMPVHNVCRI